MVMRFRFILLFLVVLLSLGFAFSVHAEKPRKEEPQLIFATPFVGERWACIATNTSDFLIRLDIYLVRLDGSRTSGLQFPWDGDANAGESIPLLVHSDDGSRTYGCKVEWTGLPDDVRANFCSDWGPPSSEPIRYGSGCLELH